MDHKYRGRTFTTLPPKKIPSAKVFRVGILFSPRKTLGVPSDHDTFGDSADEAQATAILYARQWIDEEIARMSKLN